MPRTDDNLPGLGQRTLVPRLASGAALLQKNLTQSEGYVLSRVDGHTTLWEICLLVPLRRDDTLRILRRLRADGVIEVPGSLEPMPVADRSPPATAPGANAAPQQPRSAPAPRTSAPPQRPATPELALLLDDEPSAATPPRTRPAAAQAPQSQARPAATAPAPQTQARPAPAQAPQTQARPAAAAPAPPPAEPPEPPLLALELESSAPPPDPRQRAPLRPQGPSGPTPVPSLRSFISAQSVFAAQPAAEGRSRASSSRASAGRAPSGASPDMSDLGLFQPGEPLPEVEVLRRSSRAPGLIDDLRPGRRTDPPRAPAAPAARPAAPAAPAPPARPAAPAEEPCDLTPEQRRRVDEVHGQLHIADAFTLLGVTPQDDRKAVQRAYFKLSKEFHPDRFFAKKLGPYAPRVAAVFQAITEARDILVDEDRRSRYLLGDST